MGGEGKKAHVTPVWQIPLLLPGACSIFVKLLLFATRAYVGSTLPVLPKYLPTIPPPHPLPSSPALAPSQHRLVHKTLWWLSPPESSAVTYRRGGAGLAHLSLSISCLPRPHTPARTSPCGGSCARGSERSERGGGSVLADKVLPNRDGNHTPWRYLFGKHRESKLGCRIRVGEGTCALRGLFSELHRVPKEERVRKGGVGWGGEARGGWWIYGRRSLVSKHIHCWGNSTTATCNIQASKHDTRTPLSHKAHPHPRSHTHTHTHQTGPPKRGHHTTVRTAALMCCPPPPFHPPLGQTDLRRMPCAYTHRHSPPHPDPLLLNKKSSFYLFRHSHTPPPSTLVAVTRTLVEHARRSLSMRCALKPSPHKKHMPSSPPPPPLFLPPPFSFHPPFLL